MENKIIIGELIEKEVRKQNLSINHFAESICCQRNNVYIIFKKSSINTETLDMISKVLKHNFFQDLADSIDLTKDYKPEDNPTHNNRKRFLDSVEKALKELNKNSTILFPDNDDYEGFPVPEYILPEYMITFTVGDSMKERFGNNKLFKIETLKNELGLEIEVMTNMLKSTKSINIVIDDKTEEEWYSVIKFAFDKHKGINL